MSQRLQTQLREKIDEAKRRLPLPALMTRPEVGLGVHAKKEAPCPWHSDEHPSFSVFKKVDGTWWHKCFVGCSEGDEIALLVKRFNISTREAISLYLKMAGLPPSRPPKSHECPKSLRSPEYPVSPVSNGQGLGKELQEELEGLGFYNACEEQGSAAQRRFKLARDVRALEKRIRRKLTTAELMLAFNEWHGVSQPFLDSGETREDHLTMFLAELTKVRVPTGEGDKLKQAHECVLKLSPSELPVIPGMDVPESWRRIAALHRELARG